MVVCSLTMKNEKVRTELLENQNEDSEEYLARCVVDPLRKKFYVYSDKGTEKELECDTIEEFMNVLSFVRAILDEEGGVLAYANPL